MLLSSWRRLACATVLALGVVTPLLAQQPTPAPAPAAAPAAAPATPSQAAPAAPVGTSAPATSVSPETLQSLVSTLKSETDRAKLIAQLQAMIDAQNKVEEKPGLLAVITRSVSEGISQITDTLSNAGSQLADLSSLWQWLHSAATDPDTRSRLLEAIARIAGVLGCGLLAMMATHWLLGRLAARVLKRLPSNWGGKLAGAGLTFFIHAAPLAAFAAAAFVSMPFLLVHMHIHMNQVVVAAINAVLVSGVLVALGRAVLQPSAPHVRVLNWSDETAAYADVWLRRFVITAVVGYMAVETAVLFGLPYSAHAALQRLLGLLISVLLIVVILQNRHNIAKWLRTTRKHKEVPGGTLRARLANHWHILAIIYVLFVFVVWLLRPSAGLEFLLRATFLTALVLALAIVIETALERLLTRVLAVSKETKARFPAIEQRANRYLALVFSMVRLVVGLIALLVVLRIWGVDSFGLFADQPGRQIVIGVMRIIGIVIGAMVLWELAGFGLERYLERTSKTGRLHKARVKTMLPVARHILGLFIVVLALLMLLSEVGIAIGPLLAGAGVVGLALGLGAQSLVKDLIAGFSFIMEDALAVGDVVRIGEHSGVVEQLTIRSLRLRDGNGTVHHIPLGSITIVQNMTKDFAFAPINLEVPYNTKLDDVITVLNDVAADLSHDSAFADQILGPIEIFGLDKFTDGAYMITGRLKTKPGKQWNVGRELNRRLKATLDARNISLAKPVSQMVLGPDVMRALGGLGQAQRILGADGAADPAKPEEPSDPTRDVVSQPGLKPA